MMRSFAVAVAIVGLMLSGPAIAAPTSFTATITTFTGGGSGLPTTATPLPGCIGTGLECIGSLTSVSASSVGISAGIFTANQFNVSATNAGGTVPLPPTPFSIYVIGQIVNQSSLAGSLSAGGGPGGGFGGNLGGGSLITVLLGLVGLPPTSPAGSLVLPVNVGSSSTVTTMASILPNAVTVTVGAAEWTTGSITFNDANLGTTNTGLPISNPVVTSGTATGSNTFDGTNGVITLVAPVTIRIPGTGADLRAGYSILTLSFVPEPGTLVLLGAGFAGLVALGRRKA